MDDDDYKRWDEEDDQEPTDKFDECYLCKYKYCQTNCDECDSGEFFEEDDPDDLGSVLV